MKPDGFDGCETAEGWENFFPVRGICNDGWGEKIYPHHHMYPISIMLLHIHGIWMVVFRARFLNFITMKDENSERFFFIFFNVGFKDGILWEFPLNHNHTYTYESITKSASKNVIKGIRRFLLLLMTT